VDRNREAFSGGIAREIRTHDRQTRNTDVASSRESFHKPNLPKDERL
jgi:hypothetical protein